MFRWLNAFYPFQMAKPRNHAIFPFQTTEPRGKATFVLGCHHPEVIFIFPCDVSGNIHPPYIFLFLAESQYMIWDFIFYYPSLIMNSSFRLLLMLFNFYYDGGYGSLLVE